MTIYKFIFNVVCCLYIYIYILVLEYSKWLGMDLATDPELIWIAREGLMVQYMYISKIILLK